MPTATATDGTTIHFEDHPATAPAASPSGDPVVLVHGITESGESWEPVVPLLCNAGYRVVVPDLRGHGRSAAAATYDIGSMAGDVAEVIGALGLDPTTVRLVGHSLGGMVVVALAGAMPVRSTVDVDQPLRLDGFQEQLIGLAPMLRNPETFPAAIAAIFEQMAGERLGAAERGRVSGLRRPDQEVVLGIWEPVVASSPEELGALVEGAAGGVTCPLLSLHGIDPGDGYEEWLTRLIPSATVEVWDGLGHYPHLVDPERFVARLVAFWSID